MASFESTERSGRRQPVFSRPDLLAWFASVACSNRTRVSRHHVGQVLDYTRAEHFKRWRHGWSDRVVRHNLVPPSWWPRSAIVTVPPACSSRRQSPRRD